MGQTTTPYFKDLVIRRVAPAYYPTNDLPITKEGYFVSNAGSSSLGVSPKISL